MFKKLSYILLKKDKTHLLWLVGFSILVSIIETLGISVIMPFLSVSMDFNLIHSNVYYAYLYKFFTFSGEDNFVITFGLLLVFFYIFRGIINLIYFYSLNKFTEGRYYSFVCRLLTKYMEMSYGNFTKKNSSVLMKSIVNEASNLTNLISSFLFMISEIFIIIFIYSMLLYVNYKITFILTIVLLVNSLFMIKTVSVKIKKAGLIRAEVQKSFYEILNRTFRNFKIIKLQSNDKKVLNEFKKITFQYMEANIIKTTLGHVPRLFLEVIGFCLIILIITYLVWKDGNDISNQVAVISVFILALFRLMPSVNRIMNSYNQILFYTKSLDIVYDDLIFDSENLGDKVLEFNSEIKIQNLKFGYEKNNLVLNNANLEIKKGSTNAFIGESGSGKSTIVDLLIGLYTPNSGNILIDDNLLCDENIKCWRTKIGYIPQDVYLFDGTIGENIVFGNQYDKNRVDDCLKKAKIYDFLTSKKGQDTLVGEAGVMLSGGQKQRIAIARALYIDPEILVLDEATSALDHNTESEIMNEIYEISKEKTLIIIAHRLSTIQRCENIYKIQDGKVIKGNL